MGAARQPGFGKRTQLIPDGLDDPVQHLRRALGLEHPFMVSTVLKGDHKACIRWESTHQDPNAERLRLLEALRSLKRSKEVRRRDVELKAKAGIAAQKLGQRMELGLMEAVQGLVAMEDKAIPLLCSTGLPITGPASESPFFDQQVEPQKVTSKEFEATCKRRRAQSNRRTKFMAEKGGRDMCLALHKKVEQEVADGSMGPAHDPGGGRSPVWTSL